MGQSKFVLGCALVAGLIVASRVTGQEENPFDGESVGEAPAATVAAKVEAGPVQDQPRSRHEAEQRIEAILDKPLRNPIDAMATPLVQITDMMEEEYGFPIEYDIKALDTVAASPDTEINAAYRDLSLRSALELMLRQIEDLTYVVDNEVLFITTNEEADRRLETRVYRVDDLAMRLPPEPMGAISWADYKPIIGVLTDCVEPDSWRESGRGQGEVRSPNPAVLVVLQTRRVHEKIEQLLDDIRRANQEIDDRAAEKAEAVADQPVTKGIRITQDFADDTDSQRQLMRDLVMKSVDWTPTSDLSEDDIFIEIIPGRIFVRHLPHVVKQVEEVTREMELSSGYFGGSMGGGFGGTPAAKPSDLAEPRKPSEDGGKPKRGGF